MLACLLLSVAAYVTAFLNESIHDRPIAALRGPRDGPNGPWAVLSLCFSTRTCASGAEEASFASFRSSIEEAAKRSSQAIAFKNADGAPSRTRAARGRFSSIAVKRDALRSIDWLSHGMGAGGRAGRVVWARVSSVRRGFIELFVLMCTLARRCRCWGHAAVYGRFRRAARRRRAGRNIYWGADRCIRTGRGRRPGRLRHPGWRRDITTTRHGRGRQIKRSVRRFCGTGARSS